MAESSLDHDRNFEGPLYAAASIPIYWILNLVDWVVEVYAQPTSTGYAQQQVYRRGDVIPLILGGQVVGQIPVVELLG